MNLTDTEVECMKWIHANHQNITQLGRYTLFQAAARFKIKLIASFVDKCYKLGVGDRSNAEA